MSPSSKEEVFRFKEFEVANCRSALKVGTDAVLLGAAMTLEDSDASALDIGTGTGVIALMAAQRSPGCRITGIDIDKDSCEEARGNFSRSPWSERLSAVHVSLAAFKAEGCFDLIFSNPPYYDASLKNPDAREAAARHDESLPLQEIFRFASANLATEGRLSLILPSEREIPALRSAASFGLYPFRILRIRTTPKKGIRRLVMEFSFSRMKHPEDKVLTLMDGGFRTAEYLDLTKNFYLNSPPESDVPPQNDVF